MNGLYPIIRRARRPLIIEDDDTSPPASVPPPVPLGGPETAANYSGTIRPGRKGKNETAAASPRKG